MLTLADIAAALDRPPLGDRSDFDLNPHLRARAEGASPRPAAVLCGLIQRPAGLQVVLTRRAAHLKHHGGQVAFPGGKVEPTDPSPSAAALREAQEEIGLHPRQVRLMGQLDDYLTGTQFRVSPFVAEIDPAWEPVIDPGEVAEVFEAPLDFLMDPANRREEAYTKGTLTRRYYAMPWGRHHIWGATAGMLKGLADRLADPCA
ncbi:MAG: CoA pyrophosphatase [Pseudomonadota bacterium]